MVLVWIVVGIIVAAAAFLAGAIFGREVEAKLLEEERAISSVLRAGIRALDTEKDKAARVMRERAGAIALDVKKLFPWLLVLLAIGMSVSRLEAQTAPPDTIVASGVTTIVTVLPAPGTYYSPGTDLEDIDAQVIRTAVAEIDFAAYSLTDQKIIDALVERAKHGVTVRIYLDRGELQAQCRGDQACAKAPIHELMGIPSVDIRVKQSKVLMHLKAYEVITSHLDRDALVYVRDGSANFSEAGERRQDNSLILTMGAKAGAIFEAKFREMWNRPDNLTVAQAVAGQ